MPCWYVWLAAPLVLAFQKNAARVKGTLSREGGVHRSASQQRLTHVAQVIREMLPSGMAAMRLNLDATHIGNAARFFNHRQGNSSCPLLAVMEAVMTMHLHCLKKPW